MLRRLRLALLGLLLATGAALGGVTAPLNAPATGAQHNLLGLATTYSNPGAGVSTEVIPGTSGGVPCFTAANIVGSSGALTGNALVIGGGAGVCPSTTTTAAGALTFLGTPNSANFGSLVTDETGGGGLVVLNNNPTLAGATFTAVVVPSAAFGQDLGSTSAPWGTFWGSSIRLVDTTPLTFVGGNGVTITPLIQAGTNGSSTSGTLSLVTYLSSSAAASHVWCGRAGSNTLHTFTAVGSGGALCELIGVGSDGTGMINSGMILFEVDAAVSTGIVPGRIKLKTANASGVLTTAVTVDSVQGVTAAASFKAAVSVLGTSGTVSLDPTLGDTFTCTPSADITALNAATVPAGQTIWIVFTTSGVTSRTITFNTNFKSTGTLATGTVSGKKFVMEFVSDGTNFNEVSRTVAM